MIIDILFILAMAMAIFKGYTRGFIVGLFSLVAYYIGLAAALKLSATVAQHLGGKESHSSVWMPVLSFLIVFVLVVLVVNIIARLIRGTLKLATLGWIDRIAGILLFIVLYLFLFSILMFYASRISIMSPEVTSASKVYPFISDAGPRMIDFSGTIIPFFKDIFLDLQEFFQSAGSKLAVLFFF